MASCRRKHVDHVHADAVIAIAASENAEALTQQVFGGKLGLLPWQRPGFDLGLKLGAMARDNPQFDGVVLGGHGLFTWGPTAKQCYEMTIATINKAVAWLAANSKAPAFGGAAVEALSADKRREVATRLMPAIRGRISAAERKVGHFTDAPEVLEFVNSRDLQPLAALGTSCPDHFLRTKIRPLVPFASTPTTPRSTPRWPPTRATTALTTSVANTRLRRRCAIPTRSFTYPAGRHDHLRQGQGDGAHFRRILRQRDQRHAGRLERQQLCRP